VRAGENRDEKELARRARDGKIQIRVHPHKAGTAYVTVETQGVISTAIHAGVDDLDELIKQAQDVRAALASSGNPEPGRVRVRRRSR